MIRASTEADLRSALGPPNDGNRVALVPTMGALHEGHLSLVDRAKARADRVVLSVFVNPLQFAEGEDLSTYPRPLERDAALAEARGVDVFFAPDVRQMYPDGAGTVTVDPGPLAGRLCGAYRPGHFRGVLTVVAKLFGLVGPDLAVFGQKDFQQSVLIRRMVRDLNMGITIDVAPIVREPDGLALSSRNLYLNEEERRQALGLHRALARASQVFIGGERDAAALVDAARRTAEDFPGLRLQYVELVSSSDLAPREQAAPGDVMLVAGHVGATRLIDNHTFQTEPG